jgi:bacteriocin-like protein
MSKTTNEDVVVQVREPATELTETELARVSGGDEIDGVPFCGTKPGPRPWGPWSFASLFNGVANINVAANRIINGVG